MSVGAEETAFAQSYADELLRDVGWAQRADKSAADHPAVAWARSGLLNVTGFAAGPGLMCPVPLASAADGAMRAFARLCDKDHAVLPGGAALLGQRARLRGLSRGGLQAPGGSCRLLPGRDGWLAVNLPRLEDWACVPAWLEGAEPQDWAGIAQAVRRLDVEDLVGRGRLLGLAVARADGHAAVTDWCHARATQGVPAPRGRPVVVDLSSLWAGPLAGTLLGLSGADVIKVESATRPDGARFGHAGFFDFLNGGKRCVALDFSSTRGRAALRALVRRADIVIESARPRALRQMGIVAEQIVAQRPGMVWVSITAHGRDGVAGDWVGFGDDAAVATGLSRRMAEVYGQMLFAGDAVADPLTGMHAAVAALAAWRQGCGGVLALSLAGVVARAVNLGGGLRGAALAERTARWARMSAAWDGRLYALPAVTGFARALGADTDSVMQSLSVPC